ncbi:hypothetical protein [Thauera sp.]|uniref:hypothetical protein n=1 Tax=Thauera sp. TaxID=1905334 RepID=UPI00257C4954|nr:hypothetical protein [Thauera sp.]
MPMTYEQHLDEVATLLYERYDQSEEAAIKLVMAAQADDFFSGHDDDPSICTQERAEADAREVFRKYGAHQKPASAKASARRGPPKK